MTRPDKGTGTSSAPAAENRAYPKFLIDKGQLAEREEDSYSSWELGNTWTFQLSRLHENCPMLLMRL